MPICFVGCSGAGGAFSGQFLRDMGSFNKQPIIFALSNPTDNAECTAQQAYELTEVSLVAFSSTDLIGHSA